jgi:hypothetical protein
VSFLYNFAQLRITVCKRIMTFAVIAGILAAAFTGCPSPTGDDGPDSYTVTFNADGGTPVPAAQAVEAGGRAAEPPAITKEGLQLRRLVPGGSPDHPVELCRGYRNGEYDALRQMERDRQ